MQNATHVFAYATFHLEGRPPLHADVHIVRDFEPSGMLAKILHGARNWPLIAKIGLVAIPLLASLSSLVAFNAILPADHLFMALKPLMALVVPFICVFEWVDLMNEIIAQNGRNYSYRL